MTNKKPTRYLPEEYKAIYKRDCAELLDGLKASGKIDSEAYTAKVDDLNSDNFVDEFKAAVRLKSLDVVCALLKL